uniref:AAA+ ATPase domain-containing protein n=1 Tax=Timema shepardi TaxID=629360 RepID=A0A7R9AVG4_TIMSH|nr:unnamed protein product [Timema shepardi]
MDGLDTKSEIIVIGATNRIDAIDPALRRPGRFDRELYFPLPGLKARQDILNVHVKAWRDKPNESFINKLACSTVGYCGSDLQALCGEAVMCGLRRQYPDIYSTEHMVKVNAKTLKVETTDFLRAKVNIIPAAHRTLVPQVKRLPYAVRPLLQNVLKNVIGKLQVYSPLQFLHPNSSCKYLRGLTHCPRLLLTGSPLQGHTSHLAPAILHYLEHLPVHLLDVTTLHDGSTHSTEEACIQKMREARHNLPGILYLPDITTWWDLVGEQTRVVFLTLVGNIDSSIPLFILATANCSHSDLAAPLQEMFSDSYGQVMSMVNPTKQEREEFFRPVFFIIPLLHQHNTAKENKVIGVKEIFVEPSEANLSTSGPVQLPCLQVDCSGASISPCRHLSRGKAVVNETSMSVLRSGKKRRIILDNGPVLKRKCVGSSSHESSNLALQLETGTNGNVKVKQEIKDYTCEVVLSDLDLNELLPSCSTKQSGCDTRVNISHDHLSELFHLTVTLTENCPFQLLEHLYGSLLVCITHYRNQLDRQQLTQVINYLRTASWPYGLRRYSPS